MADNLLDKASILLTPTAYDNGSMLSIKPENGDGDFDFQRSGNASRVDSSGNIVTESANIPRIDYTDGCGSWLLEGQSTNTVTYSEDFSQWVNNNNTTFESGHLAPDGTLGATKVSGNLGVSAAYIGGSSSTTATRSIYARTVSGTGTARLMSYFGNTNNLFTLTEQWQRFELTGAIATGGTNFYVDFRDNTQTLNEFIIWGAQSEDNISYATSYIPTNGATSTRLQDIANNSGNSSLINSTEGVLYAEIAALANDGGNRIISLSGGNQSNRVIIFYSSTSNQVRAISSTNSSYQFDKSFIVANALDFNKIALKYKENDFALWVNGLEVGTDINGLAPTGLSELAFDNGSGGANFFGKTKALAVYKEALTDAELQSLTTI